MPTSQSPLESRRLDRFLEGKPRNPRSFSSHQTPLTQGLGAGVGGSVLEQKQKQ